MILRFQIKEIKYDYINEKLCGNTPYVNYQDSKINIYVNDEIVANIIDGNIVTTYPTSNTNNFLSISMEDITYVKINLDTKLITEKSKIKIEVNKPNFNYLEKTFYVYGYDLGQNPNVPISITNPKVEFILIPSHIGETKAFKDFPFAVNEVYKVTADYPGIDGNNITLIGTGVATMQDLVNAWNNNNPLNTATLIIVAGGANPPTYPASGITYTLSGGTDILLEHKTYASFIGWRLPFLNELYLYRNNSARYTFLTYLDSLDKEVGKFPDILLCCNKGNDFKQKVQLRKKGHCGQLKIVDDCETDLQYYKDYIFLPTFGFYVSCNNCCNTTNCLITGSENIIIPQIDFNQVELININDVVTPPYEEINMFIEVYDCTGVLIDTDNITIPITTSLDISNLNIEIPFNVPEKGDYLIKVVYKIDGIFECTYVQTVTVCNPYTIEKVNSDEYKLCIYKIADVGVAQKEQVSIQKLSNDRTFVEIKKVDVNYCSCTTIILKEDGVYNIQFIEATVPTNMIVVVDTNWKKCAIDKIIVLACTKKHSCNCGGQCGSICKNIHLGWYDFTAFSALSYTYVSLINDEFLNNYIYTVLSPNKLDELHTIQVFLNKAMEYCSNCTTTITEDCGCK